MKKSLHTLHDKIIACLAGSTIGDAMGGPVEGFSPAEIAERHGTVDRLLPYPASRPPSFHGPFGTGAGDYTDDTRLAKLICAGLISSGGIPVAGDLNRVICQAFFKSEMPLEQGFLEEYALKALYGGDKESFGGKATNGGIMAIAPVGVLFPGDPLRTFDAAFRILSMATGSARISAAAAAAVISAAMKDKISAVDAVMSGLAAAEERVHRTEGNYWHYGTMYPRVGGWTLGLARKAVAIALEYKDPLNPDFRNRLYKEIGQSFFADGDETLAIALAMFVASGGDFKGAVTGAVNYGKDCDSYAAVAGAMAGALKGTEAIPEEWLKPIELHDESPEIGYLADGLCATIASRMRRESKGIAGLAPWKTPDSPHVPAGLLDAARSGNETEVLKLLVSGADLDERGEHGRTALHVACAAGHASIVRILLIYGDDINRKDSNKTTALHFAAWENHLDIVDLLLDWGIFPEETEGSGWTALHDSVRKEFHDIPLRILAKTRGLAREASLAGELELLHGEDRFLKLLQIMSDYHIALDSIGICGHGLLHDAKKRGYSRAAEYLRGKGVTHED